MDIMTAIETRISCRAFTEQRIDQVIFDALANEIAAINDEADLHFQLYGPRDDGSVIDMNRKMFSGEPAAYAALVAKKGPIPEEQLGYYGERLVLKATQLGLGSCWVASTYDKMTTRVELGEGEVLHDVIPLGYRPAKMPLVQRTIRGSIRARSKQNRDLFQGPWPLEQAPTWIQAAIQAVQIGPSAVNEQPVVFTMASDSSPLKATLPHVKSGMEYTDLGIAKLHFQLATEANGMRGTWEWGEGGSFILA